MWSLRRPHTVNNEGAMNRVAQELLSVCPLAAAALLLLARQLCEHLSLPAPGVAQILAATKASRSAAYELLDARPQLAGIGWRAQERPDDGEAQAGPPHTRRRDVVVGHR